MSRIPLLRPADWLALAAAPTFAVMAAATAATGAGPMAALCGGDRPLDGMVVMYLLMSAFHVSPWLRRTTTDRGDR